MEVNIQYGVTSIGLQVCVEQFIPAKRNVSPQASADPATLVDPALQSPRDFPPLIQAITPDDHVAIVVDDELAHLEILVRTVIRHLGLAGVRPGQITIVCRAGLERPDLELAWPGTPVELHDPKNRERLGYLATTKSERRVYVNRTVVEADQVIVVAQARIGHPPARWLYPFLSDHPNEEYTDREVLKAEIKEVGWLLGLPFFMQVIPGPGDSVDSILAGPIGSFPTVKKHLADRWRVQVAKPADVVIATIRGPSELLTIADVARAAHNAARGADDGTIILMFEGRPTLDRGFEIVRDSSDIASAIKNIQAEKLVEFTAARQWLHAVRNHRVLVLSDWTADFAEEIFAAAIPSVKSLTKLIEPDRSVIYLEDAHNSRAEISSP